MRVPADGEWAVSNSQIPISTSLMMSSFTALSVFATSGKSSESQKQTHSVFTRDKPKFLAWPGPPNSPSVNRTFSGASLESISSNSELGLHRSNTKMTDRLADISFCSHSARRSVSSLKGEIGMTAVNNDKSPVITLQ